MAWLPALAGGIAAGLGITTIGAAMFQAVPVAFVLLVVELVVILRLYPMMTVSRQRDAARQTWKTTAWLLLASAVTLPLLPTDGLWIVAMLVVLSSAAAVLVNRIGDGLLDSN